MTKKDEMTKKLEELGVTEEQIAKIKDELGAENVEDLNSLTEDDLIGIGIKPIPARKIITALTPTTPKADPTKELAENEEPSADQVAGFAGILGADPTALMLLMSGQGGDMDLSSMMPIAGLVAGYNPKRRDLYLTIMGQVERRLGVPIVVINGDGSIDRELTTEYIEGLEEGREPAENNIYFDSEGIPHEVIRVGVDAQSIYDADPLNPSKALQKSGMGIGRVNWSDISLEVKQVAFYAVTKTREIDPNNDAHLSWLRDHIKKGVNRLVFHGQAPRAIAEYNEAARTGSLPTLRVMLSRSPRRQEIMPRRRKSSPRDLSGIGMDHDDL
ncbi:hypothetical protein A2531_02785 [Candidatus Falkowbacteria bacterium RIFOXYD2_FULL_34_120]|uniref:SAM domain-containing protein n=1 Tax=Candidatus Falkowbacteria bacterium RIFOXYD2_FULL_34_120 TaxID=1798007 RepID=A0A1F5TRX6_9BACT|nr:MAG: hypothetical protein A2466_03070 [Candidatus Falkowbacteria bacterium RIFOXYC2_FULL_34_220]OGF39429.1 MAG: hypothetical protein A2515_03820 [Candidatus Falkowbacteria bacterium RIFOXYD12_FULL_34_57]OGF41589.1 MAG: hypothetical protein A2531_02785 [Candidatus Falkowbacteria bacterium RIFOXYD2_FULL_34_120]